MKHPLERLPTLAGCILLLLVLPVAPTLLGADGINATTRVSVASDGTQANGPSVTGPSQFPSISADGRYVAFASEATNLVLGDTNGVTDVFLHDLWTGGTTRASVASDGTQANGMSSEPAISADGCYVAFASEATNLVLGDSNGVSDVFVHDMQTGQTTRASVTSDGTQANNGSIFPSISGDGRFVAFESIATNLVPGDTNEIEDVFVHDMQTGQTTRASVTSDGTQGNRDSAGSSISSDGRYVAFISGADNLVPGDTNLASDIFVHDMQTGQTTRASVTSDGTQSNGSSDLRPTSISGNGRYVAFESQATNLAPQVTSGKGDIFLHDIQAGQTALVSAAFDGTLGNDASESPSISADGRYVAFDSNASNLVPGDTNPGWDVFVRDMQTGQTTRVSVASDGTQGNGWSRVPSISANGQYVAFKSYASNLVPADTNLVADVFVHYQIPGPLRILYFPLLFREASAGW